jgi:hypothetical protein
MTDIAPRNKDGNDIAPLPIWEGILARRVEGRHITFAIVELEPGARYLETDHGLLTMARQDKHMPAALVVALRSLR